jgi:CPA2 family monovalent cation:H+ antiporter-2
MDISLVPFFLIPGLILIAVSVSSKFILVSGILSIAKYGKTTALRTGIGMSAARGELSLVVVKAGQDVGAISNSVFPILGVVTIITTFITPYLLKFGKTLKFVSDSGSTTTTTTTTTKSDKDNDHLSNEDNGS